MKPPNVLRLFLLAAAVALTPSCEVLGSVSWNLPQRESTPGEDPLPPTSVAYGPSEEVFNQSAVVQIALELADADWQQLRHEGRSPSDIVRGTLEARKPYAYTSFLATASVEGIHYSKVRVQKAGYTDLSSFSPELKIDFAAAGPVVSGLEQLALKNDLNDPTLTRECMALNLFRAAGYPASRCHLAEVTVNGDLLGHYLLVEPVNSQMLHRHFSDASGDLYLGQLADFFEETIDLVANDNVPPRTDRSALLQLVRALDSSDETLLAALDGILNIPAFIDFWALETLMGHWDGYSRATNNFYLYLDPSDHRFVLLPWDLDQAFEGTPGAGPVYEPTVYYTGRIANRLYSLSSVRDQFRRRLAQLNDELWDEAALLQQADDYAQQVSGNASALEDHKRYLATRGQQLREALQLPAPEVPITEPFSPPQGDECAGLLTAVRGSFRSPVSRNIYSSEAPMGTAWLSASPDGQPLDGPAMAFAGPDPLVPNSGSVYVASEQADGSWIGFALILPEVNFVPGTHPLHSFETFIPATTMAPFDTSSIVTYGFVSDGEITLEEASLAEGNSVSGHFSGTLVQLQCSSVRP